MLATLTFPQAGATPHAQASPESTAPPWGKRTRGHNQHPPALESLCGTPYSPRLILLPKDCRGSSGLNPWEPDCDREVGGSLQQQEHQMHTNLLLHYLVSIPDQWLCSSTKPNWGHVLTRELSGIQICLILLALEPSLPCPGKEPNHSPIHGGECLPAPSDLEAVWISRAPAKRWTGRADHPQNRASTGHGGFPCYEQAGGLTHSQSWGWLLVPCNQTPCLGNGE